jgi:hypothetical protein
MTPGFMSARHMRSRARRGTSVHGAQGCNFAAPQCRRCGLLLPGSDDAQVTGRAQAGQFSELSAPNYKWVATGLQRQFCPGALYSCLHAHVEPVRNLRQRQCGRADNGYDQLRHGGVAAELAADLASDPFQHFDIETNGTGRRPAFNGGVGRKRMVRDGTGKPDAEAA